MPTSIRKKGRFSTHLTLFGLWLGLFAGLAQLLDLPKELGGPLELLLKTAELFLNGLVILFSRHFRRCSLTHVRKPTERRFPPQVAFQRRRFLFLSLSNGGRRSRSPFTLVTSRISRAFSSFRLDSGIFPLELFRFGRN